MADAPGPQRIRLSRAKGYRKPEGAIVVARPSRWGNPFKARPEYDDVYAVETDGALIEQVRGRDIAVATVIQMYRGLMYGWSPNALQPYANFDAAYTAHLAWLNRLGAGSRPIERARTELAGHDLACWCPAESACHADVLLELANP